MNMELEAGPALDVLVAERVFGHEVTWGRKPCYREDGARTAIDLDTGGYVAPYSTDIEAAWLVVERMRELGYGASIATVPGYDRVWWDCWFSKWEWGLHRHVDASAPLAICRAALASVAQPEPSST